MPSAGANATEVLAIRILARLPAKI